MTSSQFAPQQPMLIINIYTVYHGCHAAIAESICLWLMCKLAVDMFLPGRGGMQMCGFKLHAEESPHLTLAGAREEEKSGNASLLIPARSIYPKFRMFLVGLKCLVVFGFEGDEYGLHACSLSGHM